MEKTNTKAAAAILKMNSGLWFILNLAINDSVMPMAMAQTACTKKKMPIDADIELTKNRLAIRAPYMANFIYPVDRIRPKSKPLLSRIITS